MDANAVLSEIKKLSDEMSLYASQGNGIAHITYVRLQRLSAFVSSSSGVNINHPSVLYPLAWASFLSGKKIEAIKELRTATGWALKEAKDEVDSWDKL